MEKNSSQFLPIGTKLTPVNTLQHFMESADTGIWGNRNDGFHYEKYLLRGSPNFLKQYVEVKRKVLIFESFSQLVFILPCTSHLASLEAKYFRHTFSKLIILIKCLKYILTLD